MELVSGYPFWLINNGLPFQYPKLIHNTACDVAIIGGGISGALTAYHLMKAGIDCTLIDGRTIGLGSTCASTSLLQYELDLPLHKLIKKVGEKVALRSYRLCSEAVDKLINLMNEIGFKDYQKTPSLFFSKHAKEQSFLKKEFLVRKKAGFEVELLSVKDLKKNYGLKATGGILSSQGATNNAYMLTHALLQYCIGKGMKVYDRSKVKEIQYEKNKIKLKTEEGFVIRCNYLINATGYEVVNFIGKKFVEFHCTYAIVSEQNPEQAEIWKDRAMMWDTDNPYLYMLLTKDNRIMAGGRDEPAYNDHTMNQLLKHKARLLERDIKRLMPHIQFKKEFSWNGAFGVTKDSLPYIGSHPDTPRTFYALGFGGNGITFSMIAAEILRDILTGKTNEDKETFSFKR
jgi:glycine/D-amino acid oxidase-like deaminating enzyme